MEKKIEILSKEYANIEDFKCRSYSEKKEGRNCIPRLSIITILLVNMTY